MRRRIVVLSLASVCWLLWWLLTLSAPAPATPPPAVPPLSASLRQVELVSQRPRVFGYERAQFGARWAPDGACTTRERELLAQLPGAHSAPGSCRVVGGQGVDPYTGLGLRAEDVELDHVFPLAAAWDMGAALWDADTRRRFANDPLNLLAVEASVNRDKSDKLPAAWMPPGRGTGCFYARRVAAVAAAYGLQLTYADAVRMRTACVFSRGDYAAAGR